MTNQSTAHPSIDPAELDRLEALAKAATPGPWLHRFDPGNPTGVQHGVKLSGEFGTWICDCLDNADRLTDGGVAGYRNAQFIAAANPATILALIAQARAAHTVGAAPNDVLAMLKYALPYINPRCVDTALARTGRMEDAYINTIVRRFIETQEAAPAPTGATPAQQANVLPPTRDTGSQQDPSERAFDALYGAVMNIPCRPPTAPTGLGPIMSYQIGHRDARHAAAELISEAASGFREGRNASTEPSGNYGELAQQATVSDAKDAARLKALHAAVSALYFDDSSDFRSTLGSVIRHLDPALAGDMLGNSKVAYDKVCAAMSAPNAPEGKPQPLTLCATGRDGECGHAQCPQLRDGEPHKSGRHCPLDNNIEEE